MAGSIVARVYPSFLEKHRPRAAGILLRRREIEWDSAGFHNIKIKTRLGDDVECQQAFAPLPLPGSL
jgi:hypothetical protein